MGVALKRAPCLALGAVSVATAAALAILAIAAPEASDAAVDRSIQRADYAPPAGKTDVTPSPDSAASPRSVASPNLTASPAESSSAGGSSGPGRRTESTTDPRSPWVVVNKHNPMQPLDYAPTDLVTPSIATIGQNTQVRAMVAEALKRLAQATFEATGREIVLASGYRSFATQEQTHAGWLATYGVEKAEAVSARPGFSEHQTGLAADLAEAGDSFENFGETEAGRWVAEYGWRFGFIIRFQAGQEHVTGYEAEPWHVRYVGVELARYLRENGHKSLEAALGFPAAPDYLD